jgi:hypothetical protein
MWQEAEDSLAVILEQAPQNGDALICKLLLKTGNKTLDTLAHSNHYTDVELLQSVLDSADQETAQKLLDIFYGLKRLPAEEYRKVLQSILPYEYENREKNIQEEFQDSLAQKDTELFDLLLQTLDSSEVDHYIAQNQQMLVNLLDGKEYEKARKYIANILSVNEGNLDVLRVDCEISLIINDGQFIKKFETILKYARSTNKYVRFVLDKILEDRKITATESDLLKKLLAYYKGELIELKDTLLLVTALLIKDRQFQEAEYFNNLILAEDSQCADAWLYLCFIGTQSISIEGMADSDVPMNKCRGFDEYCSLIDKERQTQIFSTLKKQQEKIAEKSQKKYNIAIVEDACQSMGGKFNGQYLGTIGDAGAYSYNYYKIMTSGEGGALVTNSKTIFERALIYHDSSAVAFFGSQLDGITEPIFGGSEFRVSDITGAILREQLKKLGSIIDDLHKVKFALINKLSKAEVAPSNDADGDCATTIALRFDTADACNKFASACEEKGLGITIPINTGKHIYTNWTQIMEKRGALHPAMDPFKFKENQGLQMDYTMDMCPRTLDLLSRTAYINLSPDWSDKEIDNIANIINASV